MRASEDPLHDGAQAKGLVRVGATVRRPPPADARLVEAVLGHLEAVGFPGSPRLLGLDGRGRQVLTFIDGEVAHGLPHRLSDARLRSATVLIRRFHDATTSFPLLPAGAEVICHGDLGPHNTVFRGDEAVALIDWDDGVAPGTRVEDFSHAVWCFADVTERGVPLDEQARRTSLMCQEYPGMRPEAVVTALVARFDRARRQHAAAGRPGGVRVFEDLLAWMHRHGDRIAAG